MIDAVKTLIIFFCLVVLASCQTNYRALFEKGSENYLVLRDDIYLKLSKSNSENKDIIINKSDFELSVNPIAVKNKNIGIYNYVRVGSHSYRGNLFKYDKKGIHLIDTTNKGETIKEIKSFLIEYRFSKRESEKCLETVRRLLYEQSGDVF